MDVIKSHCNHNWKLLKLQLLFCLWSLFVLSGNSFCKFYITAIPQRANEQWSVILCKFADTARYEPETREWYQNWITDTVANYFLDVSNGLYNIKGSEVIGWITLPWTAKHVKRIAEMEKSVHNDKTFVKPFFGTAKKLCIKFASQKFKLNEKKITILNTEHGALYDKHCGVLITPRLLFNSVITHEMIHSLNIGHSYSDRNVNIFPFAHIGEYDDRYDIMSAANAWMYLSNYGLSGPGLNGPHLDFLGWLPSNRIYYFGRDGKKSSTLRLASLSIPHNCSSDWLLIMIPFDKNNSCNIFTLEFRTPTNYDSGIKQEAIILHKVELKDKNYYSTIITHSKDYDDMTVGTEWVYFFDNDTNKNYPFIKIRVDEIDRKHRSAVVHINSRFSEILENNVKNHMNNTHVVKNTISTLNETIIDKTAKTLEYNSEWFFKNLTTFGMNTCRSGYVWRMIDSYDYICVSENRYQQIHNQNRNNTTNKHSNGTCYEPFVIRRAFYMDDLCVTHEEFSRVQQDNAESYKNMKYYTFFNGQEII